MKILMVAISNHHFFQWVNQLRDSGHEVYWFDINDGGPKVKRIEWVNQIKGWKMHFNYPFRHTIKKRFPRLYNFIQKYNENDVQDVIQKTINKIKPDIVHCFEMKLSGIPILNTLKKYPNLKLIYSSWGSDLYFYKQLGLTKMQVEEFLTRTNYLITDCKRDYNIAIENGYANSFLGVFPGNGGIEINTVFIKEVKDRNVLLIKGYEDGVGKALNVIDALEIVPLDLIKNLEIVIYSADEKVIRRIENSSYFNSLNIKISTISEFISNAELLKLMGKSIIHIANSISDGMPNVLLEAMGMGAFPIQSNPGNVAVEVLENGYNGYLINDPHNINNIAELMGNAIINIDLRKTAQNHNVHFISKKYNRANLQKEIFKLYDEVSSNKIDFK